MPRAPLFFCALFLAGACASTPLSKEPLVVEQGLSIIRGGHATVWMDLNGFRVLADPVFTNWIGPLRRADPPGFRPDDLPPVDAVVISHTHMDHYDPWSVDAVPGRVPAFFPAASATSLGDPAYLYNLVKKHPTFETPWWQSYTVKNHDGMIARITAVPAAHWAGRFGLDGMWSKTYGGWIIEAGGYTVYFAGDTGWNPEMFREIGKRFPHIDLALMPIGPVLWRDTESEGMTRRHVNPPQALAAFRIVGAKRMIPIHYGSFFQSPVSPDVPLEWLNELLAKSPDASKVAVLEPGALWRLTGHTELVQNEIGTRQDDTAHGN